MADIQVFRIKPSPYHPQAAPFPWCAQRITGDGVEDVESRWFPTWHEAMDAAMGRDSFGALPSLTPGKRRYVRMTDAMLRDLAALARRSDLTYREIADRVGCSVAAVYKHIKFLGVPPRPRGRKPTESRTA